MKAYRRLWGVVVLMTVCTAAFCQQKRDSLVVRNDSIIASEKVNKAASPAVKDSTKKIYVPRTASIRSALLPGLGQAYNRKYWKIPIVYGALGTTAVIFKFNVTQYNRIRYAYNVLITKDTANYKNVDADLKPFITENASGSLRTARNEYRKNIDYSVLVFMLFWALNIVDATVDAHLKGFDVSSDLSLKIKPAFNTGINTPGLSFIFDIHKKKPGRFVLP